MTSLTRYNSINLISVLISLIAVLTFSPSTCIEIGTPLQTRKEGKLHSFIHSKRAVQSDEFPRYTSPWLNTDWNKLSKQAIERTVMNFKKYSQQNSKAKNVIMFLGDGMGLATIAAARVYNAQKNNVKGKDTYMSWENFPFVGLARTYNVDRSTPDSAATATAYLCGIKANMGTVGVNDKVPFDNCTAVASNEVKSILHRSIEEGKWTGLITTARVTHASPAGCFASSGSREWEGSVPVTITGHEGCRDIAYQLIMDERNEDIRVIFGGGAGNFLPNNKPDTGGLRIDNNNLIEEWEKHKKEKKQSFAVLRNKKDFLDLDTNKIDYALGLFSLDHMSYEADRKDDEEPSLTEMTTKAIEILKRSPKGYFLFVEGAKIDHAHHINKAYKALDDTLAMNKAVKAAKELTNEDDTLIVVTSDHSHTFSLSGYGSYEDSLFATTIDSSKYAKDGNKPYQQLTYANGPGFEYHRMAKYNDTHNVEKPRIDLRNINYSVMSNKDFQQDAGVWVESETHGGEDVAVYASGPSAHLFHSTEEQTYAAHLMMYASCVGDYKDSEHCKVNNSANVMLNKRYNAMMMLTVVIISWGSICFSNGRTL